LPGDDFQVDKYFFTFYLILYTLSISVVIGGIFFFIRVRGFYIISSLLVLNFTLLFHIAFLAS